MKSAARIRVAVVGLAAPLVLATGCAELWGYEDLTLADDDGSADVVTADESSGNGDSRPDRDGEGGRDDGPWGFDATADTDGSSYEAGCAPGLLACPDGCDLPSTASNCGSCGVVCGSSAPFCTLVVGSYTCELTCASPQVPCGGACVDTTSGVDNCGACGMACATSVANATRSCSAGVCGFTCSAPYSACAGGCVDFQTDDNNCGGCGASYMCAGGETCVAGSCGSHCTFPTDCAVGQSCNTATSTCTTSCSSTQSCNSGCCAAGSCLAACPTSVAAFACPAGGCNATGGQCTATGQGCYCTSDSQCLSAECVKIAGQNDLSCGANCSGSGARDGFDCQLVGNGIPAACSLGFGYAPSNFAPNGYAPPSGATTDCNGVYDSTAHAFTTVSCAGAVPTIHESVAQSGGPPIDILVFSSLTVAAGSTLTLTGSNAVILAVYGDATITGNIVADGMPGGIGTGSSPAASGPGGAWQCAGGAGGSGSSGHNAGGGGGGASGAGGNGGNDGSGNAGGMAGSVRGNASIVPLSGGCPGGASGDYGATAGKSPMYGGGGGGAVQISAAGTLTVTGTISAQGGSGGVGMYTVGNNHYAGGAGGGSGGAILLEGSTVSAPSTATLVNGGAGGATGVTPNLNAGGAAGTSATPAGGDGAAGPTGNPVNNGGGGGGGGYGYLRSNQGTAEAYVCATGLLPAPTCNAAHSACLCVADSDCSSGRCVNANAQCAGTCTGSGSADVTDCQPVTSTGAISCASGNCSNVSSASGSCSAGGLPCWCTADSQCMAGQCVNWPGCSTGACTGLGPGDAFHCAP